MPTSVAPLTVSFSHVEKQLNAILDQEILKIKRHIAGQASVKEKREQAMRALIGDSGVWGVIAGKLGFSQENDASSSQGYDTKHRALMAVVKGTRAEPTLQELRDYFSSNKNARIRLTTLIDVQASYLEMNTLEGFKQKMGDVKGLLKAYTAFGSETDRGKVLNTVYIKELTPNAATIGDNLIALPGVFNQLITDIGKNVWLPEDLSAEIGVLKGEFRKIAQAAGKQTSKTYSIV